MTKYDPYIVKIHQIAYRVFKNFPKMTPPLYAVIPGGGVTHVSGCNKAPLRHWLVTCRLRGKYFNVFCILRFCYNNLIVTQRYCLT